MSHASLDEVRAASAWVTERARHVRIDDDRLLGYVVDVDDVEPPGPRPDDEAAVALIVQLDAVNFGSGWHPVLRKPSGRSGSATIAGAAHRGMGRGRPTELVGITPEACADLFGQDVGGAAGELMALFARSLGELGRFVADRFDGSFRSMVRSTGRSPEAIVELLLEMPMYRDIASYDGRPVPLLKRAQITVNDLGPAWFDDLDRLTMFADNLVPHVLRVDGVLVLDPRLEARIGRGELLAYGSPEEVELRAVTVTAVERLAAATGRSARLIDGALWRRGGGARYKAVPRPRCRTTAY